MAKIILLTGVLGAGKSTIAQAFVPHAYHVPADHVQGRAADRAFPFLRQGQRHSWGIWGGNPAKHFQLHALMYVTLEADCPGLLGWRKDVIVEACILSEAWFRDALLAELINVAQLRGAEIHYLNFLPTPAVAAKRAKARNRPGEEEWHDETFMTKRIADAKLRTSRYSWETLTSSPHVIRRIETLLEIKASPIERRAADGTIVRLDVNED